MQTELTLATAAGIPMAASAQVTWITKQSSHRRRGFRLLR